MPDQFALFEPEPEPQPVFMPRVPDVLIWPEPTPGPDRPAPGIPIPKRAEKCRELARICRMGSRPSHNLADWYDAEADRIEAEAREVAGA